MKYAGGEAFERTGISRSSSCAIVTSMGAGAACAACGGVGTDSGRRAGLLAAIARRESSVAPPARVNVSAREAPGGRIVSSLSLLVYAYLRPISNARLHELSRQLAIAKAAGLCAIQ